MVLYLVLLMQDKLMKQTNATLLRSLSSLINQGEDLERDYIELQQEIMINLTLSESTRVKIQVVLDELKNTPDEPECATQDQS
jgi:hypothetical protein